MLHNNPKCVFFSKGFVAGNWMKSHSPKLGELGGCFNKRICFSVKNCLIGTTLWGSALSWHNIHLSSDKSCLLPLTFPLNRVELIDKVTDGHVVFGEQILSGWFFLCYKNHHKYGLEFWLAHSCFFLFWENSLSSIVCSVIRSPAILKYPCLVPCDDVRKKFWFRLNCV
jgi:hypothetical protein